MAGLEIVYFTDPYCSWCWATEPMLYRLRELYRGRIRVRYVMGGLVRDMADFYDATNGISGPKQIEPHWKDVAERSGQPIDERLWQQVADPHFSTWPACIAIKAAQMQGEDAGERFLRRMRRAALTERKLISEPVIQEEIAAGTALLDVERWRRDLNDGGAQQAFQQDLAECRRHSVSAFPSMLFRPSDSAAGTGRVSTDLVRGYHSSAEYRHVIERLADTEIQAPRNVLAVLSEFGPLTTREICEVYSWELEEARARMNALLAEGKAARLPVRGGEFWKAA